MTKTASSWCLVSCKVR